MNTYSLREQYWQRLEKEGRGKIIDGEFYWKSPEDPLVEFLHQELLRPCHNCKCYQEEIQQLRNELDAWQSADIESKRKNLK